MVTEDRYDRTVDRDATDEVREKTGQTIDTAKAEASETMDKAKQQAKSMVEERKAQTADSLETFAETFRESGQKLRDRDERQLASYTERTADQVEQFSNYLRTKDTDEMLDDIEMFARRQPEVFVGGAVALGLLAARFLKSSGRRRRGTSDRSSYSDYPYSAEDRASTSYSGRRVTSTEAGSERSTGWEE